MKFKTIEQLKAQEPVFLEIWANKEDVANSFEYPLARTKNILFAFYDIDYYEGSAYVLFEEDGKLYEVFGGHCSCYGLEGQWGTTEVTFDMFKLRWENEPNNDEVEKKLINFLVDWENTVLN